MRALLLLLVLLMPGLSAAHTVLVYARADGADARRVLALAKLYDAVVVDIELKPGVPWAQAIDQAIDTASTVLVLWSARAAASGAVQHEWQRAVQAGAVVVPVLLDSTPMPSALGARQGVDWRPVKEQP